MILMCAQGWYLYLVMVRWFGMRIDILSVAFLAAVAFISIPLASGKFIVNFNTTILHVYRAECWISGAESHLHHITG